MNHAEQAPAGASGSKPNGADRTSGSGLAGLVAAVVLVALEALAVGAVVVWLGWELVVDTPASYASSIALTVVVLLGLLWLVATTIGLARAQAWARPSAITWQILQVSIAVGAFQGLFARSDIGWALLLPAIVVVVLLLSRPVRARFVHEDAETA
ncbi:hypothetical protein [Agromyces seonyuensis]|uniref:Uncharacterized protein n=1 Tax=Agromyces seonyuensis TaxID=2662446 RepID=A0A6I4P2T4_9MICO|nr:hypothetical protein [Agromyces seonyuensis]MWB99942.1 hypothetical protein [Agromyces seonyuensis]